MKIGIVSGYFNPVHIGHIRMLSAARTQCDHLIVIVNNDVQQLLKKNKIIMEEYERAVVVRELRTVDELFLSIDGDATVCKSLEHLAKINSCAEMIFFNGGDRQSIQDIPETEVCQKYNIEMVFGCGGNTKVNSSSEINKRLGKE